MLTRRLVILGGLLAISAASYGKGGGHGGHGGGKGVAHSPTAAGRELSRIVTIHNTY